MTRSRHVGQRVRHIALRKRQQGFLDVLTDCSGSRVRAVEASGIPLGTVLRWQSDPWFSERYREIRDLLARDAEALRANLMETATRMALGRYDGLLKTAPMRRVVDALDWESPPRPEANRQADALPSVAELDRQIEELLASRAWDACGLR